jgi:hypothetical protein
MKVTGSYQGRSCTYLVRRLTEAPAVQEPMRQCIAEVQEASRGHSTARGNVSERKGEQTEREGPNNGKSQETGAMRREQETEDPEERGTGRPAGDREEAEGTQGARSIGTPETADGDNGDGREPDGGLLKNMPGIDNLFAACERAVKNLPRAGGFLSGWSRRDE